MANSTQRMWLHDESKTVNVIPYTTLDAIKIRQNNDINISNYSSFENDYNDLKSSIRARNQIVDDSITALQNTVDNLDIVQTPATITANGLMSKEDKIILNNLVAEAGNFNPVPATRSNLGCVIVGNGLSVDGNGVLTSDTQSKALNELTDVVINTPTNNQVLGYDSITQKWVNQIVGGIDSIDDIDNITIDNPISGQVLKYTVHNNQGYWTNGDVDFTTATLNSFTDVSISNPINGDILKYNSSTGFWTNVQLNNSTSSSSELSIIGTDNLLTYSAEREYNVIYNDDSLPSVIRSYNHNTGIITIHDSGTSSIDYKLCEIDSSFYNNYIYNKKFICFCKNIPYKYSIYIEDMYTGDILLTLTPDNPFVIINFTEDGSGYPDYEFHIARESGMGTVSGSDEKISLKLIEISNYIEIDDTVLELKDKKLTINDLFKNEISLLGGSKNLLRTESYNFNISGVTKTSNSDKSFTLNGTPEATGLYAIGEINQINGDNADYILSGIVDSNNNNFAYCLVVGDEEEHLISGSENYGYYDYEQKYGQTFNAGGNENYVYLKISNTNVTFDNLTIKPMVRVSGDAVYQQPTLTNIELQERIKTLEATVTDLSAQIQAMQ